MGIHDSRFTRVKPIFDLIEKQNDWFTKLIEYCFKKYGHVTLKDKTIIEKYWGDSEKTINAPIEYLNWAICNTDKLKNNSPSFNCISYYLI